MKNLYKIPAILVLLLLAGIETTHGITTTWLGTVSTSWNNASNWNSGIPDSTDNIIIASNAPYNLTLTQNRKVTSFTIGGDTLDLGTYTLTTTGVTYFNGGKVLNGNLNISGSLCHFGGAVIDARIEATCGYYHMNGGTFLKPVILVSTGTASTSGSGNCVFEDSLSITNNGTYYFYMGSTYGDSYQNLSITNNSTHEVFFGSTDTTFISGNLILNNTSTGGIVTGIGNGLTYLSSGKTITIGSSGFTNNYLTLKNFYQQGSTSQTLTLTGTAILNLINANFEGNLTITTPGILLKNSTFNGTTSITRNGSSGSFHCDGGNLFTGTLTLDNAGTSGRVRMANTTPDTYLGNVTFNSTNGQDVQIAYTGNNIFAGNITINSNKVVFNTASGKVTFAGDSIQTLNGSYNFPFKKLAINKNGGFVTSNATFSVDDTLFFVKGTFLTKSTNELTLKLSSKVVGASDSSYVEGPVKKIGNTGFVFPSGFNNSYRPIEISAPSTTTSEFVAEFVETSSLIHTVQRDSSLGFLIRNKYWKLNRTSGSSQVYVTLSWDSLNALVDTFVNVASWNGSQWNSVGKGNVYGNKVSGSIKSTSVATNYNEFILAYFSNEALPSPAICTQVSSEAELRGCLTFLPVLGTISISGSFEVDDVYSPSSANYPLVIQNNVILDSKVGSNSLKWWEPNCPLITTNHVGTYTNLSVANRRSIYLFAMQPGSTIQNLRIRGAHCNFQDNNDNNQLCGGVHIDDLNGTTSIINSEISCFSHSGVWKSDLPDQLNITNCYIQKIKARQSKYGVGYGVWTQGSPQTVQNVNFTNGIFDDCKAAIDGQGDPINWNIDHCTLSQFFLSEDINKHNHNEFTLGTCPCNTLTNNNIPTDNKFFDYVESDIGNEIYYGDYWDAAKPCTAAVSPSTCPTPLISYPGPNKGPLTHGSMNGPYDLMNSTTVPIGIPLYDIGGANTIIENSIFHKKWKIDQNGNINLTYPIRVTSSTLVGNAANKVQIKFNTFATEEFEKSKVLTEVNNQGGHARISDNYINADVWSGDGDHIIHTENSFSYSPSTSVASGAVQPYELALELKSGSTVLSESNTLTPLKGKKFIQYAEVGDPITIDASITNAGSNPYFIIRPNPNENSSTASNPNVISTNNYFYDLEQYTNSPTTIPIQYNQPGLYGIDVLGFDVEDHGTDEHYFKASSWQHIPVIVIGTQEQMLYFNIKDSYEHDGATTGVKKQAYLNELLIWEEDISEGGFGWEYVAIDLAGLAVDGTTSIIDSIHIDGTENVLSFSIFMEDNISNNLVSGVGVWVDDIYIPKTGSEKGDNLIKDGSCELQTTELCASCYWFQNLPNFETGCGDTDVSINSGDKKSGSQGLSLGVPYSANCIYTGPVSLGQIVASIGTYIDFTDLLSCDDYTIFHDLVSADFNSVSTINYQNKIIRIGSNLTIPSGKNLVLEGCLVVIESDESAPIKITVEGTLQIVPYNNAGTWLISHLFSCSDMWQGIVVNDGGIVNMVNMPGGGFTPGNYPSLIEDAIEAIESTEGTVNIRFAKFKDNLIGIQLIDYDKSPASTSNTEGFLGIEFSCADNILTKKPHDGEQSIANFDLIDVVNVNIGGIGSSPSGFRNKYADAIYGIRASNSNGIIINSEFDNIGLKNGSCRLCEGGIFASNGSNLTIGGTLTAGGNSVYNKNYFKNSKFGIVQTGINNTIIQGNDFDEIEIGVFANQASTSDITINENNEFNTFNLGVVIRETTGDVLIDGNYFGLGYSPIIPIYSYLHTAITIQNFIDYAPTTTVSISGNSITDSRIGIHAMKIHNLSIGADLNLGIGNTLSFPQEKGQTHQGIWIEDCISANIQGNTISSINAGVILEGIKIHECVDALINMNTITDASVPIHVFGNCTNTEFHCNVIDNLDVLGEGVVLDYAQLPDQGIKPSLSLPDGETWDNEWHGYTGGDYGVTGFPSQFKWYFDDSQIYFDPNANPFVILSDGLLAPNHFGCTTLVGNSVPDRDARYGALVHDTITFEDYSSEFIYKSKEQLYTLIKSDTSILTKFTANDSVFTRFYNETMITNIALFDRVDSLILAGSLDPANDLNVSITDTNLIETNRKTVNDILINRVLMELELSATDSATLEEIAIQNPLTGGKAVYQARAILFMEVHYVNEALRLSSQINENNIVAPKETLSYFKLIPNPANDNCLVKFEEFNQKFVLQVRHATGQIVYSVELPPDTNSKLLDTSTMDPGVYFVYVNDGKSISEIKKLIVVR